MNSDAAKLELSHSRAERFYLKLSLGIVAGLTLVIALLWAGHNGYLRWQEEQLVQRARFAIDHADDRAASVSARDALELKPSSAPAARIMAELAEKAGNRAALDWRRRVVDLEPNSSENKLAWAKCALQFNEIATVERALSSVDETGRRTAGYHAIAALLAEARGEEDRGEREWNEAIHLAPDEKIYQLRLGALQLRAQDPNRKASGRAMLRRLRDDSKMCASAMRPLISDAIIQREDGQLILQLARELQACPDATFKDCLIFLDVLRQLGDPEFSSYLSDLEKRSIVDPIDLAALLSWMSQSNLNLLALNFLKSLPAGTAEKWPVPAAVADLFTRMRDWSSLETALKPANWGQFDYLRHAYLARVLRERDQPVAANNEWSGAVSSAIAEEGHLLALARTAVEWGWRKEAVQLLWQLSKNGEIQAEALHALYLHYEKAKDTRGLYRVLIRLLELDPRDSKVQNNLAQVSLLLGADRDRARELAAKLYRSESSNATYAATYAYSLYVDGDLAGALRILASLPEEQLRDPAVAAYTGVFLTASGDKARARNYLALAARADLLPEEKALVEKAQREIAIPR